MCVLWITHGITTISTCIAVISIAAKFSFVVTKRPLHAFMLYIQRKLKHAKKVIDVLKNSKNSAPAKNEVQIK